MNAIQLIVAGTLHAAGVTPQDFGVPAYERAVKWRRTANSMTRRYRGELC